MIKERWLIKDHDRILCKSILQENLAPLRAKIGISQEELANVIGMSRQTYYAIEAGKREMLWTTYLAFMFFFSSVKETESMIKELKVYPVDLINQLNNEVVMPRSRAR